MSMEHGSARAGASEFARHVAAAGDTGRRAMATTADSDATGTALTAAFGIGLAWWGLRSGGLLGTAALLLGGLAVARVWPELTGES